MSEYRLFGIRHHGPGSARSLLEALGDWQPDCLLLEGPAEAQEALEWVGHAELVPPVALLIYRPDVARQAAYFPFARFSPEWQALLWSKQNQVPVRWMDLPQSIQLAQREAVEAVNEPTSSEAAESGRNEPTNAGPEVSAGPRLEMAAEAPFDPFALLGQAAGYGDGERYWEDLVEHRRSAGDVFEAIAELMTALRAEAPPPGLRERQREAWMRQSLRQALKDGYQRIAVICGAWHVPAIVPEAKSRPELSAKADKELLKNLPKVKTEVSWIPWTHSRLGWASGYGAGIESPGWYAHLWEHQDETGPRWLARVARLLRAKGIDVSSAHLIEAVRLSEALAALREKPRAGLLEFDEAVVAVLTQGRTAPLQLIAQELSVGQDFGRVPDALPAIPLQQDLEAELKKLRMKITAADQTLSLDLRKERDRDKSALLHRLLLLDVPWGEQQQESGRKGSFGESWVLAWQPEFSLRLIEAGVWGHTLAEASAARTLTTARTSRQLGELTTLLDQLLLANLPATVPELMQLLQNQAALTSDTLQLLAALPPLGRMLRYGSVRQLDAESLRQMLDGMLARVCLGLPLALKGIDAEVAHDLLDPLGKLHQMLHTLQEADWLAGWMRTIETLASDDALQGVLAGYFSRLLFDLDRWPLEQLGRRLSRMISPGTPLPQAAGWIEGLLQGSGLMLLHHQPLLKLLDQWIVSLGPEAFLESLPLIRRSFARFENAERRQLGEVVKAMGKAPPGSADPATSVPEGFDLELARKTLPMLELLLGVSAKMPSGGES